MKPRGRSNLLTVERALQELRQRGFTGRYTVVRQRVRLLRPRPAPAPLPRFETSEGAHYVKQSAMLSRWARACPTPRALWKPSRNLLVLDGTLWVQRANRSLQSLPGPAGRSQGAVPLRQGHGKDVAKP